MDSFAAPQSDKPRSRRILVLYWQNSPVAFRPTIQQHLHLLDHSPRRHELVYHNAFLGVPGVLRRARFDVIVLHTTLLCMRWGPDFPWLRAELAWLRNSLSCKVALPQDEYDHCDVLDDWLADLRVTVIGSAFDAEQRRLLYCRLGERASFFKILTGYIDEDQAQRSAQLYQPVSARPLDLVYRAAHLPYYFGTQGQLKHWIGSAVSEQAARLGLNCDISTRAEDTITSGAWYDFLSSARATIGCESGASAIDRRGELREAVRSLLQQRPDLDFAGVSARLPAGWDSHRFFALGPRHLEAVLTRTAQLLVEGAYDGILQPWRHYLPIRRDFANLADVLEMVRDHALLQSLVDRAYEDVFLSGRYTYAAAAGILDRVLDQHVSPDLTSAPLPLSFRVRLRAAQLIRWLRRIGPRTAKHHCKRLIRMVWRSRSRPTVSAETTPQPPRRAA